MMYKVKLLFKHVIRWIFGRKWRVIVILLLIYSIISEVYTNAATWSMYDNTVNSTALNYLSGVLENHPLDDYVIFRSGQYAYTLAYGDLEYENGIVTGDVSYVTYNTAYQQYSSSISTGTDSNFSLTVGSNPLYSNLSDSFSDVIDRKGVVVCVALGTFFITYLTYRMFNSLFID